MEFVRMGEVDEREVAVVVVERMFALTPRGARVRLTPPRPYLPACLRMGSGASMVVKCLWQRARWGGWWSLSGFRGLVSL